MCVDDLLSPPVSFGELLDQDWVVVIRCCQSPETFLDLGAKLSVEEVEFPCVRHGVIGMHFCSECVPKGCPFEDVTIELWKFW